LVMCVNEAAQHAEAAVDAEKDAETTLTNLLGQLNHCGVFVSDDDTTTNNEYITNNDEDTHQESDQDAGSGNIDTAANISNWGDNAALCVPVVQSGNTGNDQAGQQLGLTDATVDGTDPSGDASELSSELSEQCAPAIDQSAAS
jgi:hypothetical protein